MTKFHITVTGDAAPCTATKKACPRGGKEDHYATAADARRAAEEKLSNEFFAASVAYAKHYEEHDALMDALVNGEKDDRAQDEDEWEEDEQEEPYVLTIPDNIEDVLDNAEHTREPLIDANGNLGDYQALNDEERKVFENGLELVDVGEHGERYTAWINGEPFDENGCHQYFDCVMSGFEVLEDQQKEEDTYTEWYEVNGEAMRAFYDLARRQGGRTA